MKKRFCAVLLLLACSLFAQEHWEYFTSKQDVNCIDFEGDVVWLGTTAGITRINMNTHEQEHYDLNIGLQMLDIKAMAVDSSGVKWFSSYGYSFSDYSGVLYTFDDYEWQVLTTDNSPLPSFVIYAITVDSKGVVYLATKAGLVVIDNDVWTVYDASNSELLHDRISGVYVDNNDNRYLSYGTGFSIWYNDDSWLHNDDIDACDVVRLDADGNIWCVGGHGLDYNPVTVITPDSVRIYNYKNSGLKRGWINAFCIDADNNKWFAPEWDGIYNELSVLGDDEIWTFYTPSNSLLQTRVINEIKMDKKNNIWICSQNGLTRITNQQWKNVPINSIIQQSYIRSLSFDKNNELWAGGQGGVSHLVNDQWTHYYSANSGLQTNSVYSVAFDQNDGFWTSTVLNTRQVTQGYISHFDGTHWTKFNQYTSPVMNAFIIDDLVIDSQDCLWFTKDNKIACYDHGAWQDVQIIPGINDPHAWDIFLDQQGGLWFASAMGVSRYLDDEWSYYNTENSNLNTDMAYTIRATDSSNIWAQTVLGVSHFDGTSWENYEYPPGYVHEGRHYEGFAIDSTGMIWVYTYAGLFTLQNDTWALIDSTAEGLPLVDVMSIAVDADNNKWFGTKNYGLLKLGETYTGIKDEGPVVVSGFQLYSNFPNPFNATTTLTWKLAVPGHVNITIYNTLGQHVATLVDGYQTSTQGSIKWHGRDDHGNMVTSGIYIARLTAGDVVKTVKMAFVE